MIRVRMGTDHIFQPIDPLFGQIILYRRTLIVTSGVNKHIFPVAGNQYSVPLPDIHEMYRKLGSFRSVTAILFLLIPV